MVSTTVVNIHTIPSPLQFGQLDEILRIPSKQLVTHCMPLQLAVLLVNWGKRGSSSSSVRGMPKCVQSRSGTLVNLVYLISVM